MRYRGSLALIKKSLLGNFVTTFHFFSIAFGRLMTPFVYMLVWIVAAGNSSVDGFTRNDFFTYYMVYIFVNQISMPDSRYSISYYIFSGQFTLNLLKPMPVITDPIAYEIALKAVSMPFVITFIFIMIVILPYKLTLDISNLFLFSIALLLSIVLRFIVSYSLSIMALLTNKIDSLIAINDTLIFLLAGQVVPVMILPDVLRKISIALPFRYMLGFPIELLLGKLNNTQIISGISIQIIWISITTLICLFIWKKGLKHYTAVGG